MQLFYDPDLLEGTHHLRQQEAQHVARVLRKRPGDRIDLVDGRGGWYTATITDLGKRDCLLDVEKLRQESHRADHSLTLMVAPTKQIDRFEWLLEKVTEIGIDRIQPILTEHSERSRLRLERLERVIESAMKQSLRAWLPVLCEPLPLAEVLTATVGDGRYLAYLGDPSTEQLSTCVPAQTATLTVAIGPEGGFSPEEARLAADHGFTWVRLGPHRLRTETAAITAVHTLESARW